MKLRYKIEVYDRVSEFDAGICFYDTEMERPIHSLSVGSKEYPNINTARVRLIQYGATRAVTVPRSMSAEERMYWLTQAAVIAADDAYADQMDEVPDDRWEDTELEIEPARHNLYEAVWAMSEVIDDE